MRLGQRFNRFNRLALALGTGVAATVAGVQINSGQPAIAQNCVPLEVVGGEGTTVEKTVSPPSTGITQSNWNTDFVVPAEQGFSRYYARIVAEDAGDYDIEVYLKYPDETVDEFFNVEAYDLATSDPLVVEAVPRETQQPYQVNIQVGGVQVLGNTYQVSVVGCQ